MRTAITDAHLASDVALFSLIDGVPHVLLIERDGEPYEGHLAIPGGYLDRVTTEDGVIEETFRQAAERELGEEAGLDVSELTEVGFYATPGRDPRGRVISVAFAAFLKRTPQPTAGSDARTARWWPLADVLGAPERVAFDHHEILGDALKLFPLLGELIQPTD